MTARETTGLDRRRFLVLGAAGLAGVAWGRAEEEAAAEGFEAFDRDWLLGERGVARRTGKPLLVLVFPLERSLTRGTELGSFLNHAKPEAMAPLALAHVVCARRTVVEETFAVGPAADEPMLLLVETDGDEAARWLEFDPDGRFRRSTGAAWRGGPRRVAEEERVRRRNAAIGARLRSALLGDVRSCAARAARCAAMLAAADLEHLERTDDVGALDLALVDRGAAQLAHEAARLAGSDRESDRSRRAAIESALAAAATTRLREGAPPGARWGIQEPCGGWIEGEEEGLRGPCGMAHVPPLGRRFLDFYTGR
ncbi:MAG: hypothetical protein ACF8XB_15635 [Planctomycetota bacterium JB042]